MLQIYTWPTKCLNTKSTPFDFEKGVPGYNDLEKFQTDMINLMIASKGIGLAANQIEGCLSFPDIWVQVKRPKKVTVTWQNMNNEKLVQHLDGMESKCFQHELDHLDGINFNKRVSKMRWDMAKKKAMKT